MPVNDFLPFGLGIGSNVLTATDWAADSERVMGFERGLAKSIKSNTAWRHCSFVTAGVAFLVSEALDEDVLDNGDMASFLDQLRRGLVEVTGGPDAPDDGNTYVRMYKRWVLGDDLYLALLGGEMRGFITLHAPPILPMHAANRGYVDDALADLLTYLQGNYLPLSGGQMTGFITLHAPPTQPMHAVNKFYVDDALTDLVDWLAGNYLPLVGGQMHGFITLHAQPEQPMHAATKFYVDDAERRLREGFLPLTGGMLYRLGGDDVLEVRADQGRNARIYYHVVNTRLWVAGADWEGYWGIVDTSANKYRLRIGLDGNTQLWSDSGDATALTVSGSTYLHGWLVCDSNAYFVGDICANDYHARGIYGVRYGDGGNAFKWVWDGNIQCYVDANWVATLATQGWVNSLLSSGSNSVFDSIFTLRQSWASDSEGMWWFMYLFIKTPHGTFFVANISRSADGWGLPTVTTPIPPWGI